MTSPEGAHTTPCHGAVQGSPDSQLPLLVHPGPPVAWYRSVSAAAWLGGVAPVATWLPSRTVVMAAPNAAAMLQAADDQQSAPRGRRRPTVAVMPLAVVLGALQVHGMPGMCRGTGAHTHTHKGGGGGAWM